MPRIARNLSTTEVASLEGKGLYAVGGEPGLYLKISQVSKSWIYRFSMHRKRHDFGIGGYPRISLKEAREIAKSLYLKVCAGINPVNERKQQKTGKKTTSMKHKTFRECAFMYIEAKRPEWRNTKHARQWESTLVRYAFPFIGDLPVGMVDTEQVMAILTQETTKRTGQKEELWKLKNETAKRLQGRIKQVLESAKVKGWRGGENPARWEGHLEHQLASPGKIQKTTKKHHRSLHYSKIGLFMRKLREERKNIFSVYAYALEFLILTAARSNEVRSATWDEIDLEKRIWSIPAEKMKTYKQHRVPLSTQAIQLLHGLPRTGTTNLLFPSPQARKKMPDNVFRTLIGRMGYVEEATAHGFRSTFRKWGIEKTQYPREAQEYALAHREKNEVVAAYTRTDMFESRIDLMQDWADFCDRI